MLFTSSGFNLDLPSRHPMSRAGQGRALLQNHATGQSVGSALWLASANFLFKKKKVRSEWAGRPTSHGKTLMSFIRRLLSSSGHPHVSVRQRRLHFMRFSWSGGCGDWFFFFPPAIMPSWFFFPIFYSFFFFFNSASVNTIAFLGKEEEKQHILWNYFFFLFSCKDEPTVGTQDIRKSDQGWVFESAALLKSWKLP